MKTASIIPFPTKKSTIQKKVNVTFYIYLKRWKFLGFTLDDVKNIISLYDITSSFYVVKENIFGERVCVTLRGEDAEDVANLIIQLIHD